MAIGDPKTATAMKKELAALKKKRDAGDITAFQFRKQSNAIRKKYGGKPTPSNVSKIFTYISTKTPMDALRDSGVLTPSPRSAKARAKAKETSKKTTVSDAQKRRQVASGPSRTTTVSDAQKKRQTMKLPKSPPKRLKKNLDKPTSKTTKKSEKMYNQINTQTGKVDFSKPKVTAAKRLQQEDKYKAFKRINKTAKQSLKKKGK
jgi:hypothetical protein